MSGKGSVCVCHRATSENSLLAPPPRAGRGHRLCFAASVTLKDVSGTAARSVAAGLPAFSSLVAEA